MAKVIEWIEPFDSKCKYAVTMRMTADDVIAYQREREPRYESDEQALYDFLVVNWAKEIDE